MEGIGACIERRQKMINSRRISTNCKHTHDLNKSNVPLAHGVHKPCKRHRHPTIMMSVLKFPEFGEPRYIVKRYKNNPRPVRVAEARDIMVNLILRQRKFPAHPEGKVAPAVLTSMRRMRVATQRRRNASIRQE